MNREGKSSELAAWETALLDIQTTFARSGDLAHSLTDTLTRAVELLGYERGSIIATGDDPDIGYIVATSDDPSLSRLPLRLEDYPELRSCMLSREPLVIPDAREHPLLRPFSHVIGDRVRSIALFPLIGQERPTSTGALFLRSTVPAVEIEPHHHVFGRLYAGMVGAALREGRVRELLADQTNRLNLAKYEAERRNRAIDHSREFFESSSEGVFILDQDGIVLYENRAAEDLTGYSRGGLIGRSLLTLVPHVQRDGLADCIEHIASGANLQPFDINLMTTSGDPLTVNVATSTLLSEHGAAVLALRDVTEVRALHHELGKTKEFLERLIYSTVDAIVAADMTGKIILFNPGAERIYGRAAHLVIDQLSVSALYPDNGAKDVMRRLRSDEFGGVGRLETHRREIMSADGKRIPVDLTASILYEDGREIATVGIFTDLRERLRMEQQLSDAQHRLIETEKQAMIAELAGAAAHELNQPLTSILATAELLRRKITPDHPHAKPLDVIVSESDRMAELVRKIARITSYETKNYVGNAQIIDLDKAASRGAKYGVIVPADADSGGQSTIDVRPPNLATGAGESQQPKSDEKAKES